MSRAKARKPPRRKWVKGMQFGQYPVWIWVDGKGEPRFWTTEKKRPTCSGPEWSARWPKPSPTWWQRLKAWMGT